MGMGWLESEEENVDVGNRMGSMIKNSPSHTTRLATSGQGRLHRRALGAGPGVVHVAGHLGRLQMCRTFVAHGTVVLLCLPVDKGAVFTLPAKGSWCCTYGAKGTCNFFYRAHFKGTGLACPSSATWLATTATTANTNTATATAATTLGFVAVVFFSMVGCKSRRGGHQFA